MDEMAASNQKAMEAMLEKMNAIIANNGKSADKENNPPASSNSGSNNSGTKRNRKKCQHCGKLVFHKPTACLELEANAGKRWAGWKSVKDTADAAN